MIRGVVEYGAEGSPLVVSPGSVSPGLVSLVGAGPGDPDLLTVRAVRALERAESVIYDRLVAPSILALLNPAAMREYAGKGVGRPGSECHEQRAINERLITLAGRYRHVVRLKGGDPLIFGRGGEEALALQAARVPYEIIPGVTAAVGCAAYAGIPLTHRGLAQQVTLVTAHRASGEGSPDWQTLVGKGQTVVFYMGVGEIHAIQQALLGHGQAPATPIALIENGCTALQRVFGGNLAEMSALARRVSLAAPAVIVVGEVAGLGLVPQPAPVSAPGSSTSVDAAA